MSEINQWSLKYRPRRFEDVYGQDTTVKALKERIIKNDIPTAVLFQGPFGTGKTTLAEMFAAAVQAHLPDGNPDWDNPACKSILSGAFDRDTIRLDGSQLSGKSDIVDFTKDLNMKPMLDSKKILLIEEVDQISSAGMSSLLKVLENVKSHVLIILLSMEDKVSGAIKSRCQCYQIKAISTKEIMMNLKHVMEQSGDWTNETIPNDFRLKGLSAIATAAKGSMRQAVQFLEQCIVNEAWTIEQIDDLIGVIDEEKTWKILDGLLHKTKDKKIWRTLIFMKTGDETQHFVNYSIMMLSEAMIYKETGVCADDSVEWRHKALSSSPYIEELFYCLSLHPQLTKPFIRTSDILAALAAFYQEISFKPGSVSRQNVANPEIQRLREDIGDLEPTLVTRIEEPQAIKLGSTEKTPTVRKVLGENKDGVKLRTPKTDISNLEIVF